MARRMRAVILESILSMWYGLAGWVYEKLVGVVDVDFFFKETTRRLYSSAHRIWDHRCDTIVYVGPVMKHPMLRCIATVLRGI